MKLKLNGTEHQVDVADDTALLWTVREEIGDKSIKFGCGKGLCGACTVLVNGNPMRSCVTPASVLQGMEIETIPGLTKSSETMRKLQAAWDEDNVAQCGYCQSGQLLAAKSLLDSNPKPSEQQIKDFMSANLCRCGTYTRIVKAVKKVSEMS